MASKVKIQKMSSSVQRFVDKFGENRPLRSWRKVVWITTRIHTKLGLRARFSPHFAGSAALCRTYSGKIDFFGPKSKYNRLLSAYNEPIFMQYAQMARGNGYEISSFRVRRSRSHEDEDRYSPIWLTLTYSLSLPVEHRPQTTPLHLALSCAAASIFLELYLKLVVRFTLRKDQIVPWTLRKDQNVQIPGRICLMCLFSLFIVYKTTRKPTYIIIHCVPIENFLTNCLVREFGQELSYGVSIEHYVEAIYNNTVTLKSRLIKGNSRSLETKPFDRSYTIYY